jgi:GT2 family glycosyltransferase
LQKGNRSSNLQSAICNLQSAMLSIIIPTHRRLDLLRACLHAVGRHAPAGCEVVVVDDASPGGEAGRVAAVLGAQVVRLARQGGFARAANAGIRASRGEVVELLNDDTEVQPGWADAALAHFADPSVGAVAPLVLVWPDGRVIDSAGDRYYLGGVAGKRGHGEPVGAPYLRPGPVFGASASSGFYRRAALDRVGLFPESFGSYFEDVDLAFRLRRAGWRAVYEPAARVLHHVSASYGRAGRRLIERQSCNEERVFWRNMPAAALPRAAPRHLAVLAGKAWRRWEEGALAPWLLGRLRLLVEVPELLRHRRALRAITEDGDVADWQVEECYWGDAEDRGQRTVDS